MTISEQKSDDPILSLSCPAIFVNCPFSFFSFSSESHHRWSLHAISPIGRHTLASEQFQKETAALHFLLSFTESFCPCLFYSRSFFFFGVDQTFSARHSGLIAAAAALIRPTSRLIHNHKRFIYCFYFCFCFVIFGFHLAATGLAKVTEMMAQQFPFRAEFRQRSA